MTSSTPTLATEIEAATGINPATCYQCGKCSAGCPMASESDLRPHQVMRLVMHGLARRGPPGRVHLAVPHLRDLQRALPQRLRPRARHRRAPRDAHRVRAGAACRATIGAFHKAFLEQIRTNGRLHEMGLVVDYKLRSRRPHEGRHQRARPCSPAASSACAPTRIEGVDEIKRIFEQVRGDAMNSRRGASSGAPKRHRSDRAEAAATPAKAARGIAYYPGCSLHGTSREYDESLRAVVAALGIAARRDPRLDLLRRQQRPHHRPPARRGAAGAQPGARRGAGLRPRAGALRRLLQPPLRGAPRRRRQKTASPSACPRSSAARSPTPSRCSTPCSCCTSTAPTHRREGRRVAGRAQPARRRQARRLLRLPARPPARGLRLRRPRAADARWTTSSTPAAPTPSTGT